MISRIAIKNFRSLRDVELRPGPLTVLIGANGAGKSNVLDALRFIKAIYSDRFQVDDLMRSRLEDRGGFNQVVWGGNTDFHIRFEVELPDLSTSSIASGFTTEISNEHGRPSFVEQHLLMGSTPVGTLVFQSGASSHVDATSEILRQLDLWQFYKFSPDLMRKPTKVRQENVLNESGSNLSTVIHSLFSAGHPGLEEAVSMLQVMVPTVERLVSPIFGDGQTYVALKEKGIERPIGAWGLSDGTLLALALSVALVTEPLPNLICMETPEAEIHPVMMETVADLLEVASRDTQVIVTTQSTRLLDWLPYERFVIVEKKRGETQFRPLAVEEEDHEFFRAVGVGNAWYSGSIGGIP